MKKFHIPNVLLDKGSEGGGAVMDDAEFQSKVLGGVKTLTDDFAVQKTKQETLLSDVGRLTTETKTVLEDITRLKTSANDTAAKQNEFLRKLAQMELQMRREIGMAYGSPIRRIQNDEKLRTQFNLMVRNAVVTVHPNDAVAMAAQTLQKALGEDSSPGSTVIDDALAAEVYDTLSMFGAWNTFAVRRLSTKQTKYPIKTARPVANFILTEAGTVSDDTNKAGTSVTLEVEIIAVLLNVSLQLLEDAEIDVTADVLNDFAEAYANRLDVAAFTATGAADATNGGMTGATNFGTAAVAAAGGTKMTLLVLEDFIRALTVVDPIVLQRPSKWWMHPQQLVRSLAVRDNNGRPIFLTALEAPSAGAIGSILGYPVIPAHVMSSSEAISTKLAVFGDPEAFVVGVRRDFVFEASDHHRWNTLERSFRGWGRAGTKGRRALGLAVLTSAAA